MIISIAKTQKPKAMLTRLIRTTDFLSESRQGIDLLKPYFLAKI